MLIRRGLSAALTALCGMALALALAGSANAATGPNTTSIKPAVSDCTISQSVNLQYTNYDASASWYAYCSSGHWIVSRIQVYDSAFNVLLDTSGNVFTPADGSWHLQWNQAPFNTWLPAAHACIWIYQDSGWGPLLYSGCTL
jgi:hypothetical protein